MWVEPVQKLISMGIVTLALYGVIKLEGRQAKIMAFAVVAAGGYLATVYRKLGTFYETSVELKTTLLYYRFHNSISEGKPNGYNVTKWVHKYVCSVQVFRMDVGAYYYVQKNTVLAILDTILNATITLLLS